MALIYQQAFEINMNELIFRDFLFRYYHVIILSQIYTDSSDYQLDAAIYNMISFKPFIHASYHLLDIAI